MIKQYFGLRITAIKQLRDHPEGHERRLKANYLIQLLIGIISSMIGGTIIFFLTL